MSSSKAGDLLYAIEVKIATGWEGGPRFEGLDVQTGLVGSYFTSSYEGAQQVAKRMAKARIDKTTRIVCYQRTELVETI